MAVVAVVCTVFLSLDTTAVLLTPVVVRTARQEGLSVLPVALATVWLASTARLLLPMSNLTNLLAQNTLDGISPARFAAMMWAPALVAAVVPLLVIGLVFRTDLHMRSGRNPASTTRPDRVGGVGDGPAIGGSGAVSGQPAPDNTFLVASCAVLAILLLLLVSGVPVWVPSTAAAIVLTALVAVRRRQALTMVLVPWPLLLFAAGMFLAMEAVRSLGAPVLLGQLAGQGNGLLDLLRLAATGAAGANLVNNLPAYLLIEPAAATPHRLAALLIGVNAGALVTPWASLATLLWHDRLKRMNVVIRWKGYVLCGVVAAPLTVAAAVLALALESR